jgi:nephrocystin-3
MTTSRTVRLFLSSTFRDFREERDLLVKRVFPALRARLKERFVELVDVDLRWGITAEQAERGEVLPICLAEIDRARPYFIGMLGERYGWIPPASGYAPDLLERQPWLRAHLGGASVTELEILHGVLNSRRMRERAFFYFRSPAYARTQGGEYLPDGREDRERQRQLKNRIRARGLPVTPYANPEALAVRIERDLWKLLDSEFPASQVPDAYERERLRHEAYAAPRRRLYLGGERYLQALDKALESGHPRIIVEGASGSGKSALIANFFEAWRRKHRKDLVFEHYLGASADAADPHALVRRLVEFIKRHTGSREGLPGDPQQLMESLPQWLATASSWARKRRTRFIFVLDAINSLTSQADLRWWPTSLPAGITMVVSCLPGSTLQALKGTPAQEQDDRHGATPWRVITVKPLGRAQSARLLEAYLARFNKQLPRPMVRQVQAHPLASNPLFVRTLAEELRLFGVHETLQRQLDHYLAAQTVDDLFERVLYRVERDMGKAAVRDTLTAVWASRAGLTEKELLALTGLTPATWAAIRYALDEALLEINGRISFAHDYVRLAVRDRYLASEARQRQAHRRLGRWFGQQAVDARRVEEEPWQWLRAAAWQRLQRCLTDEFMVDPLLDVDEGLALLGYWMALPGISHASLEAVYRKAWRRWNGLTRWSDISRLAFRLCEFLRSTGANGEFVITLARLVLQLDRNAAGDAPTYGPALSLIGVVCLDRGELTAAREYLQAAFEMGPASGCDAAELARRRYNYAKVLLALEQIETGREMLEAAVGEAREAFGPASPETLPFLHALADLHEQHGDVRQAWRLTREALGIEKRIYGSNDLRITTSLNALGWLHLRQGDTAAAEPLFRQSIDLLHQAYGPDHAYLSIPQANLAMALMRASRHEDALPFAQESARLAALHHGEFSDEAAARVGVWATILQHSGRLDQAEGRFREAVHIARERARQLGREGSLPLATALSNLGLFLYECGRSQQALEPLRQALVLQEQISGEGSRPWAVPAFNLAAVLKEFEESRSQGEALGARAQAVLDAGSADEV